jgi:DNA invertase Pin-like site-specific DNA recombinase
MSLDVQEARIRAWAAGVGATVVEVIEDAGVSGTKPLANRPGGARIAALLDARKPDVDAVVVLRTDRLGRDAAETLQLFKRFRTSVVGLVSVAEHFDLATPHGRAMAQMGAVFSELERALIAARTAEGLAELRRQGRAWNHPPFGWRAVQGRLVADKREQATLARARELRAEGKGYATIAKSLTAEGRRTKRGGPWHAMSVRSVLRTAASVGTEATA